MVKLKQKLAKNQFTLGSWLSIGHPAIAEIMAKRGYDWLALDMEHSVITLDAAQQMLQVIEANGVTPLVRVEENDPCVIKRILDAGAHGVIVPMVNSKEDALRAVEAVKYPLEGKRGVGLARAQGYGFNFEDYVKWARQNTVLVVLIEHIEAINNLEKILSVKGIDGTIIGPYDLSGSLGVPGEFDHPKMVEAIKRYESVCRRMKKPLGVHVVEPNPAKAKDYKCRGYSFMAVGLDSLYLGRKCQEIIKEVK